MLLVPYLSIVGLKLNKFEQRHKKSLDTFWPLLI